MRHLITGGTGFIGGTIARKLAMQGEQVRVLDIVDDPSRLPEIEFQRGSVTDAAAVSRAMKDVDVVHHNAALVAQSAAGQRYYEVNREGARNVALAAARGQVGHIIHLSTTAVYGLTGPGAITSYVVPRPIEDYGRSKLAGESAMKRISEEASIPLTTIRPRVTLGPGRLGIFHILFEWIRDGASIPIIGNGAQRQQFIHVDDLIAFHSLALKRRLEGTFNVGTDSFGTLRQDLEGLIAHAGSASRVRPLPVWPAVQSLRVLHAMGLSGLTPWHYRTYHCDCFFDIQPLLALGWKPAHSNASMLRQSYDWFVQHAGRGEADTAHRAPLRQGVLRLLKTLA
ncbi:NAD(P)-dependent oxidoreductase [Croceibacterium sp. LX-88]|jgi:nucleoside-diphosphate-sugar epimerase|uniref:NAD(P)-dependent oxidoreductase n=1 Tax=Croceibacterium selenioxidans TaxID=2838833 RepID=A0ABS5VZ84_9SPHN|nr:NAD(P)-dependent oxidoreductase [Croceibacterium selenioxidans]MBT2132833.1 NAD(P)-dependent oxidoreductase [Croceibacterium selenioxidans]